MLFAASSDQWQALSAGINGLCALGAAGISVWGLFTVTRLKTQGGSNAAAIADLKRKVRGLTARVRRQRADIKTKDADIKTKDARIAELEAELAQRQGGDG